tara:strand:+ start:2954 stop:3271 length:318 start_codon:yes stop_codon:yes gene_type:complete
MEKSTYQELKSNPPKFNLPNEKEQNKIRAVVLDLCSVMCDNRYRFTFKKNQFSEFTLFTHGFSFSNFQIKAYADDLEWLADEGDWEKIIELINEGTQLVEKIKYR